METVFSILICLNLFGFKSYYVVWKRNIIMAGAIAVGLFKSYYVVWKLEDSQGQINSLISLNRTM